MILDPRGKSERFMLLSVIAKFSIRGLTPELRRTAARTAGVLHDSAQGEAAKRSRLERIVRRMKRAVCSPADALAARAALKISHQPEA